MPQIISSSIGVTVGESTVVIRWSTDIASESDLRLAELASLSSPVPSFDSLHSLGAQENGVFEHTYTLNIGVQVVRGGSYGGYPFSVDGDGEPMNCDSGGHCKFPSFTVPIPPAVTGLEVFET